MLDKIFRLNHDAFRFEGEKVVYTDPFQLTADTPKADIILITHDHYDHCSPDDVKKVVQDTTTIVTVDSCKDQLEGLGGELVVMGPGDKKEVQGVAVEAVPAYNVDKEFHPKKNGWVGYIVTLGHKRIYHAGDTDRIPEMKDFKVDIALLPVSGTYVMTAEEAVGAAGDIGPEVVIPMHYDAIVGDANDANRFAEQYAGQTVIKEQSK